MSAQADLLEYIDFKSVECLNQQPAHPIGNALKQVSSVAKQLGLGLQLALSEAWTSAGL